LKTKQVLLLLLFIIINESGESCNKLDLIDWLT